MANSTGMHGTTAFTLPDTTVWKEHEGCATVLKTSTGHYYSFDETATFLWKCLATGKTIAESVESVIGEYDVADNVALADVTQSAQQFVDEQLLAVNNQGGT